MPNTLLINLDFWATCRGSHLAYIFLNSQGEEEEVISFEQLRIKALQIAVALTEKKLEGERIILALSPGVDFIVSFFGCLYARAIAVPLPLPRSKRQLDRSYPVIEDAMAALILTNRKSNYDFSIPSLSIEELLTLATGEGKLPEVLESDIAFLQYTSGSTSTPKGVVLTHFHLYHHQKMLQQAFDHDEKTKIVGWLPFYHDMGLIGNILHGVYLGVTSVLMAPLTFIQRPILWFQAISKYRATTSGGPNFGYQHCIDNIADQELEGLDLTCWKIAFNGAERVQSDTLKKFFDRFSRVGFSSNAFYPCYGLAEATLFVTGCHKVHSKLFKMGEGQASDVVSCGQTVLEGNIAIVDPNSRELCKEGEEGEVWVQGLSVAAGYWNKEEENQYIFKAYTSRGLGPFLRTGDIGFVKDKELFILGRLKNLIIIRGKNYYPYDLERCIQKSHPLLAKTKGIVISQPTSQGEELIVLQEIDRKLKDPTIIKEIFKAIKECLIDEFDLSVNDILLLIPNSLPRTTSGKFQYHLALKQFQNGLLAPIFFWNRRAKDFGEEEKDIIGMLAQLLGIPSDSISPNESVITLGIDSLVGMQFLGLIHRKFGVEIDLGFLLNGATPMQIQELIKKATRSDVQVQVVSETEYPLSWNQENVWTFQQLNPQSLAYNICFSVRLKGEFNISAFREALSQVMRKHTTLRTKFELGSSGPIQRICQKIDPPLFIHDLKSLREEKKALQIQSHIQDEQSHIFDLNEAPLFRIVLLEVSAVETVVIFHFHHMICDGWSIKIFISELEKEYRECVLEAKKGEETLPSAYNSFIRWQKEFALTAEYTEVEKHWKELLVSDEYPILAVSPFVSEENSENSSSITFFLDEEIKLKWKTFSIQQKTTLSIVLMTAFHAILHLYSGEDRVYVGYPAANRPTPDFQQIIGFFVNTLVCKTKLELETNFLDLMQQVKRNVWQGAKEAAYPFHHLLNVLRPPRFSHTSPIFQVMFVMQNAPIDLEKFASLEVELLKSPHLSPLYDLVLEVQEKKSGIDLIFEYQREKISAQFAEQIGKSYLKFLSLVLQNPNCPLGKYNLSNDKEETINAILNREPEFLEEYDIVSLFEIQARKNPDKIAIFSDQGNFTYKELDSAVTSISNGLIKQGINRGEPIGICIEKEPILIASLLGVLKAGGAYVPIDPAYPVDRIQVMLEKAQIRFLITREKFWNTVSFFKGKWIDPFIEDTDLLEFPSIPSNLLAYILYTSGSTGEPKGVMVERKSLANFVLAALDFFDMKSSDRSLQFSSITWDTSSEEIYPCLLSGGSLVLRSDGPVESFGDLLERTKKYQVTIWNLPSSYWHDLVEMMHRKQIAIPPSLRLVIVGGEKVNHSKVTLWHQNIAPEVKLLNTYGATEATSISATFDLSNWQSKWVDVPIGRPIKGVRLYILNPHLEPVAPGMPGTLYIGGAGVSRGYINLPELTRERFITHPKNHDRIYNTGDTAYYALSGEILLRGRKDRQIKRRGFRIELEEVEKALLQWDLIETCVVMFDRVMTAYIVIKGSSVHPSSQEVKTFLRRTLPDHLIPDYILIIPNIPRLPNGKIDGVLLKSIKYSPKENESIPSLTGTEKEVLVIWQSVLGIDSLVKEESFFDVGGNSLLLIRLHEKLQEFFSIQFNISILFAHFTIASQAQKIEEIQRNSSVISEIELLERLEKGLITITQARELFKSRK